jgi:tRNA-dihydrouridine synthase
MFLFFLAPMAEISHRALRELVESFRPGGLNENPQGPDLYFSEMITAGALLGGGPFERWYTDGGPCPERLTYQLTGSDPELLARSAAMLDKMDCAGVDINMGCSAPAIVRTGAGVRWMSSVDRAGEMIGRVRKRVKKRLSVKLRLGLETGPEQEFSVKSSGEELFEYLIHFCRRLEEEGVELITLHPRTDKEKFKRRARREYVSRLGSVLKIPVAGNGDIDSPEEMLRLGTEWDAVMVGRLAVRCPWVFSRAREKAAGGEPRPINLEETALSFLDLLAQYQPPEFHISRARRFFNYFCDNLTWAHHVKTILNREDTLLGMARALETYFGEHGEERFSRP